jgi:hypothetical protein
MPQCLTMDEDLHWRQSEKAPGAVPGVVEAMSSQPYAAAVIIRVEEGGRFYRVTVRQWASSVPGHPAYSYRIQGLGTSGPGEPVLYPSPEEAWLAAMATIPRSADSASQAAPVH